MAKNQAALSESIKNLDPADYQEIRDAYYKAVEGLQTLADALEMADAKAVSPAGPLMTEHFLAINAIETMNKSQLGRLV